LFVWRKDIPCGPWTQQEHDKSLLVSWAHDDRFWPDAMEDKGKIHRE